MKGDSAFDLKSATPFRHETGSPETAGSYASTTSVIESILARALYEPITEFLRRPSKNFRSHLVTVGFRMASETQERTALSAEESRICASLSDVLESIHSGSLVIDDIQDGSKQRRGAPSMHERYGLPLALNAGNWLYFRPFEWIRELDLPEKQELAIYRLCHQTMFEAHLGQAIDLGTRIDEIEKDKVKALCMRSLRLKTGALTSLALGLGAIAGSATPERLEALREFGHEFGMALQMFDDIGNLNLPSGTSKRHEDLILRRPTWVWAVAADQLSPLEYRSLIDAVRGLPDDTRLMEWLQATDFVALAREEAKGFLDHAMMTMHKNMRTPSRFGQVLQLLNDLSERIQDSYG